MKISPSRFAFAAALLMFPWCSQGGQSQREQMQTLIDASPTFLYHAPVSEIELNKYFAERAEMAPGEKLDGPELSSMFHKVGFLSDLFSGNYRPRNWSDDDDWDGPWTPRRNGPQGPVKVPEPAVDEKAISVVFNHDEMKNPNDWKVKYFDVVVVVNKSAGGQFMQVYRKPRGWGMPELVRFTKVVKVNGKNQITTSTRLPISTGRETPEMSNEDKRACQGDNDCYFRARQVGMSLSPSKTAPTNSYFSQTSPGYYTPQWLSIDHVSGQWEDSAMDHAVFFHDGIATHRAPPKYESRLGQRASGACVRLSQNHARELFWIIRATGGPYREGELRQGRKFWFDGGKARDWNCASRVKAQGQRQQNRSPFFDNDDDYFEDAQSCRERLAKYLPFDCTTSKDRMKCLELEKNLPWRCYTKRMKENLADQLACLVDERARIMGKTKPFFEEEKIMATERGWIPYTAQEAVQIPEFDRYTGRLKSNRLVPAAFKTLIVVENREIRGARKAQTASN